jgi:hypothetical protein
MKRRRKKQRSGRVIFAVALAPAVPALAASPALSPRSERRRAGAVGRLHDAIAPARGTVAGAATIAGAQCDPAGNIGLH